MSEIMIALLLLVPIILVVIILNTVHKGSRKRAQAKIHQYVTEAVRQTNTITDHHEQLIHQTVVIDRKNRRLLVIDHKEEPFSHELFYLDRITGVQVLQQQLSLEQRERLTTHIVLEIKADQSKLIYLYDYHDHNSFQLADFNKAASALQQTINKARTNPSPVT